MDLYGIILFKSADLTRFGNLKTSAKKSRVRLALSLSYLNNCDAARMVCWGDTGEVTIMMMMLSAHLEPHYCTPVVRDRGGRRLKK